MDLLPSTTAATFSVDLPSLSLLLPFFFSQPPRRKPPNIFLNGKSPTANDDKTTTIRTSRRSFTLFSLFPASISFSPSLSAVPLLSLERYTDEIEGFTLLKPSTWAKMEKAGAKALFEEGKGSNSIGVVVNPVRLSSLKEFGTPEFVAEKLIQAESRKSSTRMSSSLQESSSRSRIILLASNPPYRTTTEARFSSHKERRTDSRSETSISW